MYILKNKKKSKLQFVLDVFFEGALTLKDSLKIEGEHYLFIYKDKCLLVTIKNNSVIKECDVTKNIDKDVKFKKFEYDGYIYKKYRDMKGLL